MKQLKTLVIALVMFVGAQASAQSKVAHIDVQALMTNMPEMKAAQSQLDKIKENYDKEYKTMVQEYQTKMQKYEQEAPTAGEALNESRSKEMQEMGGRIQQFQQSVQTDLGKKEMELLKPILEKAQKAIQKVATAKGFDYVLDATTGGGVLVANGPDILADVKKELGF
ncbi:OmpH family outer membrane protein [Flavobacterium haoranii]|uniref:Periplasmic chaperone for outer membrane proteins Skp n=1 Tax=Flavobacterium haoranii TaxID=683124 RepID=A0A1M6FWA8_9FLAO|nr:OmpH family outer membrane protein [Flavobacterium haoranii]SHJ01879.1 periplasmic chaperone for outer membrane proteins Skp [Flavobacterium haoranii]